MKLYKDKNDKIFAFEKDGSQDHLITKDMVEITQEKVDEINSAREEDKFNALSYTEKRVREYPPIEDYIDGIVKGDQEQVQAYIDACLEVKKKYPKDD